MIARATVFGLPLVLFSGMAICANPGTNRLIPEIPEAAGVALQPVLTKNRVHTSTAAAYQEATILCLQKLKDEKSRAKTSALELDLAKAHLVEAKAEGAHRITRSSRAWAVAGAAACAGGLVASVAGLALRKEALGYGGAAVAAGGCAVLGWMW